MAIGIVPKFNLPTGVNILQKSFGDQVDALVQREADAGRSDLAREVHTDASSRFGALAAAGADAGTLATAFGEVQKTLILLEERYNPQLYAKSRLQGSMTAANGGNPVTTAAEILGLNLDQFETSITTAGAGAKDPKEPDKVKEEGRKLLAGKHIDILGVIDGLTQAAVDAHIGGIANLARRAQLDPLIKGEFRERTRKRVAELKAKLDSDEIKWTDIRDIINNPATTNSELKTQLTELIKDKITSDQIKTEATAEGTALIPLNLDQVSNRIKASPEFATLRPEVQTALSASLDSEIENYKEDVAFKEKDEKMGAEIDKLEKSKLARQALIEEWKPRLRMIGKAALILGLVGVVAGPLLMQIPEFADIFKVTIPAFRQGSIFVPEAVQFPSLLTSAGVGGLVGASAGALIGGIRAEGDVNIKRLVRDRQNKQEALRKAGKANEQIDRKYQIQGSKASVAMADLYARYMSLVKGYDTGEYTKQLMESAKLSKLNEQLALVNGTLSKTLAPAT